MKKLLSMMMISIISIFIVGCGNDNNKNVQLNNEQKMQETVNTVKSLEENYNEIQKQNNIKNKSEIFVGKDLTGNECYLVVDSVKIGYSGVIDCAIKLYKNRKVDYEVYTFKNNDGIITFSNSKDHKIIVDENNTPLEYNILYEISKIYGNLSENQNNQQVNTSQNVDDTLHITAEEFKRRYNKNLESILDSAENIAEGNALKNNMKNLIISGMHLKNLDNSISYQFDTAFPMLTFQDKNNNRINTLMIGCNSEKNDPSLYAIVMVVGVYSLYNDKSMTKFDDTDEIRSIIQDLTDKAISSKINKNGINEGSSEIIYRGNKFNLTIMADTSKTYLTLLITNENYKN